MKTILYISDVNSSEPIFHSQVLPQVQKLREFVKVTFLVLSRKNAEKEEFGNSYFYNSVSGDYSPFLSRVNFERQRRDLKKYFDGKKFDIIYSRGIRGGILGVFLKKFLFHNKIKLINDVRGDALDENKNRYWRKKTLDNANKYVFVNTDLLFLVSTYLKNKICNLYAFDKEKAFVFPTFVPDNKFSFNERNRLEIRKQLGYNETDIVVMYSGNLAKWQNIETILSAFSKTTNSFLRLLILTKDTRIEETLDRFNINREKVKFKSVLYDEIEKYYHAGDYGTLIRDNTDTNKSAAPTKFSEYVNSGLAVIINEIDADYVRTFKTKGLKGVLLPEKGELTSYFNQLHPSKIERNTAEINTLSSIIYEQKRILI